MGNNFQAICVYTLKPASGPDISVVVYVYGDFSYMVFIHNGHFLTCVKCGFPLAAIFSCSLTPRSYFSGRSTLWSRKRTCSPWAAPVGSSNHGTPPDLRVAPSMRPPFFEAGHGPCPIPPAALFQPHTHKLECPVPSHCDL